MGEERDRLLAAFTRHFEHEVELWDEAMRTGETGAIEAYIPAEITCYFARCGMDRAEIIDRKGVVSGMRQSVSALKGCRKRFENRLIRMRGETEAVIFFEQVIERDLQVLARLFTIETYRLTEGNWRCIREVVEHVGA